MKLVKRQELMEMPEGTLYCELREPWIFSGLSIKGSTINIDGKNIDFGTRGLEWVDADNSGEAVDRLEEMLLDSSVNYPVEAAYGREGMFDDEQVYMVYDKADIKSIFGDLNA